MTAAAPSPSKEGFWIGPYGVLVPLTISVVTASDGYNTRYQDGSETGMYRVGGDPMTRELYLQRYAQRGADGAWYYKRALAASQN